MKIIYTFILILLIKGLYSQTADGYYNEMVKFLEVKELDKALESINNAITLDSSEIKFFLAKATILKFLGEYEKEYFTRQETIDLFPYNPAGYINRGIWHSRMNEFEISILDFTIALNLAEKDKSEKDIFAALWFRGNSYENIRNFKEAYTDFTRALLIDSTNVQILVSLGSVCTYINKEDDSWKYLLRAIEIDSSYKYTYIAIGFKYQEMSRYEDAIKEFNKVIQMDPDEALAYSNRSYCRLKKGDLIGAKSDIEKSIQLSPTNAYAYRNRALIYIDKGNYIQACKDIETALYYKFTLKYGDELIELKQKYCEKK